MKCEIFYSGKVGILNWKLELDGLTYTGTADCVSRPGATEWAFDESTPDFPDIYSEKEIDEIHDTISDATYEAIEKIMNS